MFGKRFCEEEEESLSSSSFLAGAGRASSSSAPQPPWEGSERMHTEPLGGMYGVRMATVIHAYLRPTLAR